MYFSFTEALHWHRCEQGRENRLETMKNALQVRRLYGRCNVCGHCEFCKFHLIACWAGFKQLLIGLGKHSIVEVIEVPPWMLLCKFVCRYEKKSLESFIAEKVESSGEGWKPPSTQF